MSAKSKYVFTYAFSHTCSTTVKYYALFSISWNDKIVNFILRIEIAWPFMFNFLLEGHLYLHVWRDIVK